MYPTLVSNKYSSVTKHLILEIQLHRVVVKSNSMHWFTGSIPEAIGESRQKGLIFVVYVEG